MANPIISTLFTFLLLLSSSSVLCIPFDSQACEPRPSYVTWYKLRHYINNEMNVVISSDISGPPLKVMRCRNVLSPCSTLDGYCGIGEQEYVTKILPLESKSFEALNLTILEDANCRCIKSKIRYEYESEPIENVPFLWDVKLVKKGK